MSNNGIGSESFGFHNTFWSPSLPLPPSPGRGQLGHDHGQQGVGRVDPNLHGALHQRLSRQGLLVSLQDNSQGAHHLLVLLL